jgi:hypothetical protein
LGRSRGASEARLASPREYAVKIGGDARRPPPGPACPSWWPACRPRSAAGRR